MKNATSVIFFALLAIAGRFLLWNIPSVEPVIPLAVYALLVYGVDAGLIVAILGYMGSDLLLAYTGEWLYVKAFIAAIAVFIASSKLIPKTFSPLITWTVIVTVLYELFIGLYDQLFYNAGGLFDFSYWIAGLPFSLTHIVSNIFFAFILAGFLGIKLQDLSHEVAVDGVPSTESVTNPQEE
jgi:hypothetical protein